ncbi:uncharacterized protein TNCV_4180341 [Trichonephila clavipes]|nr:uncharacterized protein TNCV_4180341 [Trichonephila clavipes]
MSGQYNGVQALLKENNKFANYVPCAAHSPNPVGAESVKVATEIVSFFGLVQHTDVFCFDPLMRASKSRKLLTEEHKLKRMACALDFLDRYHKEGAQFLERIVTGDETWVSHITPESKHQSMEWRIRNSPIIVKVKRTISTRKNKRRGLLTSGVLLLHDNARPHSAINTQNLIRSFGWEQIDDPPYSPDLARSDFHLFRYLKEFLGGKRFDTADEVK